MKFIKSFEYDKYGIKYLRLNTTGSGEEELIKSSLREIMS